MDDFRIAFQDMLLGKRLAIQQRATNITRPVTFDVYADVEAWGTNITRAVPSLVWRRPGTGAWTTNSLVPYLDWRQVTGACADTNFTGVITVTNDASLVATNLPIRAANTAHPDTVEYYLLLQYDPDDADPVRYAGDYLNADGSLKRPEARYYPDNSAMISNAWTCIGAAYTYAARTNTVNGISDVWLNEVSRGGALENDFIEVAGAEGTSLANWMIEVQDLSSPYTCPATYLLTGPLNTGPTNGYAFFVLGGTSVTPRDQALTNALPAACGVTLKDRDGNIRYRLAFNGSMAGFDTEVGTSAASWSACGEGNPSNRQYAWAASGTPTPGQANATDPAQRVENGGPVGDGVTACRATNTTDRIWVRVSGSADADGVATGRVYIALGDGTVTNSVGFSGSDVFETTFSNLTENTRYRLYVRYTDTKGAVGQGTAATNVYALLSTPAAPSREGRAETTVTLGASVVNLGDLSPTNLTAIAYRRTDGAYGAYTNVTTWTIGGLSPDALYDFDVTARNGDGVPTEASQPVTFGTMPYAPTASLTVCGAPEDQWEPWLQLKTNELTQAYFGNPADTGYAVVLITGASGTNYLGETSDGFRGTAYAGAAWKSLDAWNNQIFYVDAKSNQVCLVARARDGYAPTAFGPVTNAVVGLRTLVMGAGVTAGQPGQVAFTNKLMNPVTGASTEMWIEYSVSNYTGSAWTAWTKGTFIAATSLLHQVALPVTAGKTVTDLTGLAPLATTNVIAGVWNARTDLSDGHYAARLRAVIRDPATEETVHSEFALGLVDVLSPPVALTGIPAPYTTDLTADISAFSVADAARHDEVDVWSYTFNGAAVRPGGTQQPGENVHLTPVPNAINALRVWVRDEAGNWTRDPGIVTNWYVDTVAPDAVFAAPLLPARTNVLSMGIGMADNGPLGAERWVFAVTNQATHTAVTSGASAVSVWTLALPAASQDGEYTVTVTAYDRAGNASAPVTRAWTLDTVPPVAFFDVTPAATGSWQTNTAWTVSVTGDAQIVAYRATVNDAERPSGGEYAKATPFPVNSLTNGGNYAIRVWGRDAAGNWQTNADLTVYSKTVDTAAPTAVFMAGIPDLYTTQTWAQVTVTNAAGLPVQDTVVRYRWQLDGPTPHVLTESADLTNITFYSRADGQYTLSVWGYDPAGNRQQVATTASWTVDTVAPTAGFLAQLPHDVNTNALTFTMAYDGNPTNAVRWEYAVTNSVGLTVTNGTITLPTNSFTVVVDAEDTYGIRVWACDQAGNRQTVPTVHTWEADFTAPTDFLVYGVPAQYTRNTAASIYATNAPGMPRRNQVAKWVGTLNGGSAPSRPLFWLPGGWPTNFANLAEGPYALHVWAADPAGNWTTNGAEYVTNWVVDTVAPTAEYLAPLPGYITTHTTNIVMVSTGDPLEAVRWRYSVPGVPDSGWVSNPTQAIVVAADGAYTNLVWARDTAGNTQTAPSTNIWRADTTAPAPGEFTIISRDGIAQRSRNRTTNFVFGAEVNLPSLFGGGVDSNATYRYQFNTGAQVGWLPVSSNFTVVSAEGADVTNTVTVWTRDWLGNGPSITKTFSWIVDTAEPLAAYKVLPAATDGTWQTNRTWTVTVTGDTQVVGYTWTLDDGGTTVVGNASESFSTTLLSEGPHTVKVWGVDMAGNWQTDPTPYTRFVDVTPPSAALSGYPARYTTQTWARVSVTNAAGSPAQDTVVRYRWQLAGPTAEPMRESAGLTEIAFNGRADGDYTLSVWGRDPAGNWQGLATNVSWTVDTVAPSAAFSAPLPSHDINTNRIEFVLASDGIKTNAMSWRYAVTNASGAVIVLETVTRDHHIVVSNLTDGSYGIWIKASDEAGNEQDNALTWGWEIDTQTIDTSNVRITGVPDVYTRSTSAVIAVTNTPGAARRDTVAQWSVALNGGPAPARPSAVLAGGAATNLTGFIPDALNTLAVWVKDPSGNWTRDPDAVVTNWYVDLTPPPTPVFVQGPPARTNAATVAFLLVADGPLGAERWSYSVTNEAGAEVSHGTSDDPAFEVTVAEDGEYTLTVTAFDRAGNRSDAASRSWTLDRVAPVARYGVTPPANSGWMTNAEWTVSVTGDVQVVAFKWAVDQEAETEVLITDGASRTFRTPVLEPGPHTLQVRGRDEAGNWQTNGILEFTATVDTLPPAVVVYPVPPPFMRESAIAVGVTNAVSAAPEDTVAAYRWRLALNGVVLADWSAPCGAGTAIETPVTVDGEYALSAIGRDPAGNWQTMPGTETNWVRDTVAPVAWFETPIPAFTNRADLTFRFGSTGGVDAVEWRYEVLYFGTGVVATVGWTNAENTVTVSDSGCYTLRAWGRDAAGNEQSEDEPTVVLWTVDFTAPEAAEIHLDNTPGAAGVRINTNAWDFTVRVDRPEWLGGGSDTNASYQWSYNGGPRSTENTPVTEPLQIISATGPDVTNTITVWACDASLNWQEAGVTYTWVVDTVPPEAQFAPMPNNLLASLEAPFSLSTADPDAVAWRFEVPGVTNGLSATNTFVVTVPQDGAYTLSVWARDVAGNEQQNALTHTWTADTTPPDAVFATVPGALVNTPTVSFTVVDDGDSVAWRFAVTNAVGAVVTNGLIAQPANTFEVTLTEDGTYGIALIGQDLAGNTRATPVVPGGVFAWTLDTTPPIPGAQFVAGRMPRDPTNLMDVVAVLAGDADIAEWRVSLFRQEAGGGWQTLVDGFSVANVNGAVEPTSAAVRTFAADGSDDGVYKLEAVARDAAVNWQREPGPDGVWIWRSDRTAPVATFDPAPSALVASRTAQFTVAAGTDAISWRFEVAGITNGVTADRTFSVVLPQDGAYTVSVWAHDAAGNEQAVPLTHTWTADTTPPDAVFAGTPAELVNTNAVTFRVADDGDSVAWEYTVTNDTLGVVGTGRIDAPTNTFAVLLPVFDGRYTISLYGRDRAGNRRNDGDPALPGGVFIWTLDTTPPRDPGARFVTERMPCDPTNRPGVVAVLAADADIAEWRVRLFKQAADGTNWTEVGSEQAVTNLFGGSSPTEVTVSELADDGSADGVYRLTAIGRDAANNWQSEPAAGGVYTWAYDRTPPVAVFGEWPSPLTQDRTARFVASNAVERIVRWKYRVTQKSREGVSLDPAETVIEWTETEVPEFYVTVADEGAYAIELLGCDAAGNWQSVVDENGQFAWNVEEASQLVASVFRNTVVTNGTLNVEIVVNILPTQQVLDLILDETLPSGVTSVKNVSVLNGTLEWSQPPAGVTPAAVLWHIVAQPGIGRVTLRYTIEGLSSRTGLTGILSWYELTVKSERVRNLWVVPGTHRVIAESLSAYAEWATGRGLDPDAPEGGEEDDADGDGICNRDEYWADTDPSDEASLFRVRAVASTPEPSFRLRVEAGPNAALHVRWKAALSDADWVQVVPVSSVYDADQKVWIIEIPVLPQAGGVSPAAAFFRVFATDPEE